MADAPVLKTAEEFIEAQTLKWTRDLARGRLIKKGRRPRGLAILGAQGMDIPDPARLSREGAVIERIEFDHAEGVRVYKWAGSPGPWSIDWATTTLGGSRPARVAGSGVSTAR